MMKIFSLVTTLVTTSVLSVAAHAAVIEPSAAMGKGVFNKPEVANTCANCHGITGEGGTVKTAAKLTMPKTWKIYKILGGDAAFAKDKADFLKKMQAATEHLIIRSAVAHNVTFKQANPWFDVAKGGGAYDSQMLGLTAAPAKAWLKKQESKGVTAPIAATSAYLYVQTLDKQGVFK
ncbi:MAG TPA: hypothetical protein VM901_12565 [Bdellovibrionota bacterium]|nr:hypothetical protein [Bdellovibrionota bacterium]